MSLDARQHGLTPFSIYQGRWNVAFRDIESEIIPMCEDQGMAIASWASLGGGQLTTKEQRKKLKDDPDTGHGYYEASESDIKVCEVLEDIANRKKVTLQAIVSRSHLVQHVRLLTLDRLWRTSSNSRHMSSPSSVYRQSSTSS